MSIFIMSFLASCKKDIYCNCKSTIEQNNPWNKNDSVNGITKTKYFYVTVKNSTKNQAAKRECSSYQIKTEPTIYNQDAHGNVTISYQTVTNVDCTIK